MDIYSRNQDEQRGNQRVDGFFLLAWLGLQRRRHRPRLLEQEPLLPKQLPVLLLFSRYADLSS